MEKNLKGGAIMSDHHHNNKPRQLEAIGALWQAETYRGETSFYGSITLPDGTVLNVKVYLNQFAGEKLPDYVIYARRDDLELFEEARAAETAPHPF